MCAQNSYILSQVVGLLKKGANCTNKAVDKIMFYK